MNGILYGEQLSKIRHFMIRFIQWAYYILLLYRVQILLFLVGLFMRLLAVYVDKNLSDDNTYINLRICTVGGADPPITRATIMGCIALIGRLYGRKTYTLYTFYFIRTYCGYLKMGGGCLRRFHPSVIFCHIGHYCLCLNLQPCSSNADSNIKSCRYKGIYYDRFIHRRFQHNYLLCPLFLDIC